MLMRQAAEAIAAVHKAGYIHRDICPRRLIATTAELNELKLIDFGLTLPATKEFMQPRQPDRHAELHDAGDCQTPADGSARRHLFVRRHGVRDLHVRPPLGTRATGQAAMQHANFDPKDIARDRPSIHPVLAKAIMKCVALNPPTASRRWTSS